MHKRMEEHRLQRSDMQHFWPRELAKEETVRPLRFLFHPRPEVGVRRRARGMTS